jgi:hypothetical protein
LILVLWFVLVLAVVFGLAAIDMDLEMMYWWLAERFVSGGVC